jgi:catechol 2,3-dioxygenase
MAVLRMGYVHVKVTDLARARDHYANTMGLYPTLEESNRIFFKGWDEWDHHSVVLEEGGVGATKFGFKVRDAADLDEYENKAKQFGDVEVERMSTGDNPEVSDGLRIRLGIEHTIELYHGMTEIGTEVGTHNPDAFPRHLVGIGAPQLDHALLIGDDITTAARFFTDVLDFYCPEKVSTSLDDDADHLAYWLTTGNTAHDVALLKGPNGKLHHFAFLMRGWSDVLHAADIMAMDDVPIDVGPTRHGITRGETIYFWDPAGNRNETFSGGYLAHRDRPQITWTPDQLAKGIFYHARELKDTFMNVFT